MWIFMQLCQSSFTKSKPLFTVADTSCILKGFTPKSTSWSNRGPIAAIFSSFCILHMRVAGLLSYNRQVKFKHNLYYYIGCRQILEIYS